jgi:iron(III) transport system substrate-binding protein
MILLPLAGCVDRTPAPIDQTSAAPTSAPAAEPAPVAEPTPFQTPPPPAVPTQPAAQAQAEPEEAAAEEAAPAPGSDEVVVYCTLPESAARAVFATFEERTKLKVRPVFATTDGKPVNLAERLDTEHRTGKHAADVWWCDEPCRTLALDRAGVFEPYLSESGERQAGDAGWPKPLRAATGTWYGVGRQLRVLAYNTTKVDLSDLPKDWMGLADPRWSGRVGVAKPDYTATRTMLAALHATDDGKLLASWLTAMRANKMRLFDTEAEVMGALSRGDLTLAITNSDAAILAARAEAPVRFRVLTDKGALSGGVATGQSVRLDPGPMQVVQTVALPKGAPHPDNASLFVDYLLCNEVAEIQASGATNLIRVEEHFNDGLVRWCDGVIGTRRSPRILVTLSGLDLSRLEDHDATATDLWVRIVGAP